MSEFSKCMFVVSLSYDCRVYFLDLNTKGVICKKPSKGIENLQLYKVVTWL